MLPDIAPMLAGRGLPAEGELGGWAVEPKLDGWRVRVAVAGGELVVRTRPGRAITAALPELAPLRRLGLRLVLDGELVAGCGRMEDFYGLAGRLGGRPDRRREPVRFLAFDLLWADGADLTARPYEARRQALEGLHLPVSLVGLVPRYPGPDAGHLLAACEDQGLEGVVLKRRVSPYLPGRRSDDWRKVKCAAWSEHLERRRPGRLGAAAG